VSPEHRDRLHRALERAGDERHRIVGFRCASEQTEVHALHRVSGERLADVLVDARPVRLDDHQETEIACGVEYLDKVTPQQHLAAGDQQLETPCFPELLQEILYFLGGELLMFPALAPVGPQVAHGTTLIAPVGELQRAAPGRESLLSARLDLLKGGGSCNHVMLSKGGMEVGRRAN